MSGGKVQLLGRERLEEVVKKALAYSKADQTQVTVSTGQSNLTRFASSIIHQNVAERNSSIAVRAIIGKKIGFAMGNSLDDDSVKKTVEKAVEFAKHQRENPEFVSLPGPKEMPEAPQTFFDVTAEFTPEDRAVAVEKIANTAVSAKAIAAGMFSTGYNEQAIGNSLGIFVCNNSTSSNLTMVMTADTGFGYASRVSRDVSKIDIEAAAAEAAKAACDSRNPVSIEPGEYDVVLMPYCVQDLMRFLSVLGFSALAVQEGRSFMAGKFGEKICGENITIWDDGYDPNGSVNPFDGEGLPKQKVELIKNGVANAVVYDSFTANKEGKESTGHAIGGTGTRGPYATNLFLAAGDEAIDEMVASTKRGLLVTRFHYCNVIHPMQTVITGMTRDGLFLIEDGKISKPVKNLRFTESVLKTLSNVEMIGKSPICLGGVTVPALKVRGFRFTGATEF